MYRPLTGALNGGSGCLFLGGGADVEGAGEYAGGSSPGTEGGYVDWLLGIKGHIGSRLTDEWSRAGLLAVSICSVESKIISK
jgi:hypothetical protein